MSPRLKLKMTLDLGVYEARRALLVSQDATFADLHDCLQEAYRWKDGGEHAFLLPASNTHPLPVRVVGEGTETPPSSPEEQIVLDTETRLLDYLQKGDTFQYLYDFGDSWEIACNVTRYIPDYQGEMPVCTFLDGKAPPEDVGGVPGYLDFLDAIADPSHPDYQDLMDWVDQTWFYDLSKESINMKLQTKDCFQP